MNRKFLLRKRVLVPLGAGIGLMVLAWFVLLPWVVRGRVAAVLSQLKLHDATFRVTRATPWSSTVRDIDAGDGNRIDELRVSYSVEGLWNRRVDNIRISGLQLTADVREGGASIKPLRAMMREAPATSQPSKHAEEAATATSAADWPFRSVRVADSMLVVRTPQRVIEVPFNASLRWPQLKADVAGLTIEGAIGDPTALDLRFGGGAVDGADLSAVLRALSPEAPVGIAGDVRITGTLAGAGGRTALHATVVAAAATDESAEPTTKIAGTNVSLKEGVFHVVGTFSDAGRSVKVTAQDVTLAEAALGAKAVGVSADVRFGTAADSTTRPGQVVRIAKLSASKLDMTDVAIRFDIAADGSVQVRQARADFLGGVVSAEDVRVVPGAPIPLTLVAANVELRDLLALLAPGKATGEGKVNGRLPLVIERDGAVRLAQGGAEAKAGGTLRVTDTAALESIAGGVAPAAGKGPAQAPQAQVRQNIVEALKDFQYESLTAQLKNEPKHGLVAYVRMVGKGRTGAKQALDYDLRVTGLEDLLRSAIGVHRTVTREAARQ